VVGESEERCRSSAACYNATGDANSNTIIRIYIFFNIKFDDDV